MDVVMGFKIAIELDKKIFQRHPKIVSDEALKSHKRRGEAIHDELKTNIKFTQILKIAKRGVAFEGISEKDTLEQFQAIVSAVMTGREVDIFEHVDSFYDFLHGSGDIIRRDGILIDK